MKRIFFLCLTIIILLSGCTAAQPQAQVAATTLPVYEFTKYITEGTPITVSRLINESVSCLHDYSLSVRQVKDVEQAELIVINGAGLEEFMEDLLGGKETVDASEGISTLECDHAHDDSHDHNHHHEEDAHIWLSPENAKIMAVNICQGLSARYPRYEAIFASNLETLLIELDTLQRHGEDALASLSCREMITFHDGFSYFAQSFDLHILESVEEESGSEASAQELKHLIGIVNEHHLGAVFTEVYGSASAAEVISRETGAVIYQLDMAMGGSSYFDAMYRNIDTIKEAMG